MPVHSDCMAAGCQNRLLHDMLADRNLQIMELRDEIATLRKGTTMNDNAMYALWCSAGQHAFDPTDPDRKKTTVEDSEGHEITIMTCGEHTPHVLKRKTPPRAVESRVDNDDNDW